MCTYVTTTAEVTGSGYTGDDWFRVDRAVVYFDHPQDAPLDHALCIDVWGTNDRVAIELDADSARRLAETILATLDHDEVRPLLTDPAFDPEFVQPGYTSTSVALIETQTSAPSARPSSSTEAGVTSATTGGAGVDVDAIAVTDGLDRAHDPTPRVAGRSLGRPAMQGHCSRMHHREHGAGRAAFGGRQRPAVVQDHTAVRTGRAAEQVGPSELRDPAGSRPARDLRRRARLRDPSAVEDDDVVGEHGRVDRIVRDQQPHARERREVTAEIATHVVPRGGIERGQRLVQEEHRGIGGERSGERDPLRLATRQFAAAGVAPSIEPDALQPLAGPATRLLPAQATSAQAEGDVVDGVEMGEQEVVLEHHADGSPVGRNVDACVRIVVDRAIELDAAGAEAAQPGERAQQRRLARAVGSDDSNGLAGGNREIRIQRETVELDVDRCGQRHRAVSHRSRNAMRTTSEMTSSTNDNTIADSGFDPSSLM